MEIYKRENICCDNEKNILETTDGSFVCVNCAKVQDMVCFGNLVNSYNDVKIDPILSEFCHRLQIDTCTQSRANEIYFTAITSFPSLRKLILKSTAIYIASKKNSEPRTMREISSATGVDIKQIGEYERIICKDYYPTNSNDYVNRFGVKLKLTYKEIRIIEQEILNSLKCTQIQNPVLHCAIYLYKFMHESPNCLIQIQETTGIPASTLTNAYKKEFKVKSNLPDQF